MESVARQVVGETALPSRRRMPRVRHWLAALDWIAAVLSLVFLLQMLSWRQVTDWRALVANVLVPGLTMLLTMVLAFAGGQYSEERRLSRLREMAALARSLAIAFALVLLLSYLTKGFFSGYTSPSRLAVSTSLVVFLLLGVLSRWLLASYQHRLFARGEALRNILLVGSGEAARSFLEFLDKRSWLGIRCVGRVAYRGAEAMAANGDDDGSVKKDASISLTSTVEGLEGLHRELVAREATGVVVALDPADTGELAEIARLLSIAHVPFHVVPSLFEQSYRAAELLGYAELPVIDVKVDPLDRVQLFLKRALDVTVSCILLIPGMLLALVVAAAIKVDSPGPVLYRQERVGKNGRRFAMLKFRTMVANAEQMLEELREQDESGSNGQMFKVRADPRVTRVGAFLRKWSLDELPQVVNVLRGEMSLVGPRPPLPCEVENYEQEHLCRLRAIPGMTGLWQVSGRSELDFEQMVKLDRYYLENWSIGMDIGILFKTALVVFTRRGAY